LEASGDIFGRHLLLESLCEYIIKTSLSALVSLGAELTNYLIERCSIYHNNAPHKLLLSSPVNKLE